MSERVLKIVMQVVRLILGCTFILSGFVKAVDPRGFSYKVEEYLQAANMDFPDWMNLPLVAAIVICCAEFVLGIYLLLGLRRKFTAVATLIVCVVFTIISVLLVIFHPVHDCGCFGEFISLTDAQTLIKNIVLLGLAILLVRNPQVAKPLVPEGWQWIVSLYTCVFIFVFCLRSVYYLPLIDFRQYKVGADLREMVFPTHDDIKPEEISDFMVLDTLSEDQTAQILFKKEPTILIIAPLLNEASTGVTEKLATINDWCRDNGYDIFCLTASPLKDIRKWCYYNDAEYPFLIADHTLLKTMVRSNPGVMLLRDGVIRNKWSANNLPEVEDASVDEKELEATAGNNGKILLKILLWYLLPMLLIIMLSNLIKKRKPKLPKLLKVSNDADDTNDSYDSNNSKNSITTKNTKTMRQKIVAGNWKMNMTLQEGVALAKELNEILSADKPNCGVVICTPFIHLASIAPMLDTSVLKLGAENCADKEKGAYTGEVSAAMVKSTGAEYVILGHSERRAYYGETPEILKEKVNLALANGLKVIFCIGEVLEEREAGKQNEVVAAQLKGSLYDLTAEQFANVVLAYEPVWAIGTGKTATADQAEEMHAFIRAEIAKQFGQEVAENTTIQYGGSCKPSNAKELFAKPDVDGGLIGGASLKAADFKGIIDAWKD
ncbi:MAG: triose-phosphate isomerase [Bacteroidaceae bacterium]|nr:triose-phosphate isomerase [Bacteroidaceae bacterium]